MSQEYFHIDSPEKRKELEEFKRLRIDHPKMLYVQEQAENALMSRDGSFLLLVIGPTHVGKSSLLKRLVYERLERLKREGLLPDWAVPALYFELIPGDKSFSWKANIESLLIEQKEILTNFKVEYPDRREGTFSGKPPGLSGRPTEHALRRTLENFLHQKKVEFMCLDEAANLLHLGSGKRLRHQADFLKSIANRSRAKIILGGSFDVYPLIGQTAQLSSRSEIVNFDRYDPSDESDQEAFFGILCTFESFLPFPEKENTLTPYLSLLMENSVGCVGLLKKVLDRAVTRSLAVGDPRITEESLMKNLNSKLLVDQALKEVESGHEIMKEFLGGGSPERSSIGQRLPSLPALSESSGKKAGKRKPGERNPTRDKVGMIPGLREFEAEIAAGG